MFLSPLNLDFVGSAAFIIEDLEVNAVAIFLKAGHDAVSCGKALAVLAGLEGINQDDVSVYVVGGHDKVVAASGAEGETAHVIGAEFTEEFDLDVELF